MTYEKLGRHEEALRLRRDVYFRRMKLDGEEYISSLRAANNYANSLRKLQRFKKAKALLHRTIPVARRVLGEGHRLTLKLRWSYANALIADLREALGAIGSKLFTFFGGRSAPGLPPG